MSDNRPQDSNLTPAESELECALAALRPADPGIDYGQLLFAAGVAAGRAQIQRTQHWWQAAAAVAACVAIAMFMAPVFRPAPKPQMGIVQAGVAPRPVIAAHADPGVMPVQEAPSNAAPLLPAPPGSYLALRRLVLTRGIDALPAPKTVPHEPDPTILQLMQQLSHG